MFSIPLSLCTRCPAQACHSPNLVSVYITRASRNTCLAKIVVFTRIFAPAYFSCVARISGMYCSSGSYCLASFGARLGAIRPLLLSTRYLLCLLSSNHDTSMISKTYTQKYMKAFYPQHGPHSVPALVDDTKQMPDQLDQRQYFSRSAARQIVTNQGHTCTYLA